jgi:hypothetical protein
MSNPTIHKLKYIIMDSMFLVYVYLFWGSILLTLIGILAIIGISLLNMLGINVSIM